MGKLVRSMLLIAVLLAAQFTVSPVIVAAAPPGFAPGSTTRVSVGPAATPANGSILFSSMSADGNHVVFASNATNLVPGITAGTFQVYRHTRSTHTTELVSFGRNSATSQQALGSAISADGNIVVFESTDPDLTDGDNNSSVDIFARDMRTGVTRLVTANAAGEIADRGGVLPRHAGGRGISHDGRYVVFTSSSTNLVPGPITSVAQVYVKDLTTGAVERASVNSDGVAANGTTPIASISGNGRFVVISSAATNFTTPPTNGSGQIYVRDLDLGRTTLESVNSAGEVNLLFAATAPVISYDGRYVAFETQARLDARDQDSFTWDVFLRDRIDATTRLVSISPNTAAFQDSRTSAITDDGSVAFASVDGSIATGEVDSNGAGDVYLYDRATEGITLVTLNDAGQQATLGGGNPSISGDGNAVLFLSNSSNLVTTPSSTGGQLYVRDYVTNKAPIIFLEPAAKAIVYSEFVLAGRFEDPDSGQTWTATVDFGDGPAVPLALAADKSFVLRHTYTVKNRYAVTVTVRDSAGATGLWTLAVTGYFRPVIFVPGLLGSELKANRNLAQPIVESGGGTRIVTYDKDQVIWPDPFAIGIAGRHEDLNILRFDGDHPITERPDDIVPNGKLVLLPGGYGDIQPFFEAQGYQLDKDFFIFAYDWRYPVASHVAALDAKIAQAMVETGSPIVDVVAHSMGTQVTRALMMQGTHTSALGHVILAGGPNLGTPEGTYSLTEGLCFPFQVICLLDTQLTLYLLRTMPGVVEMAVSPSYFDLFNGSDLTHPAPLEERLGFVPIRRADYAYLHELMLERLVPETLIANASRFHEDDLNWLAWTPAGVTIFAGTGQCTIGTLVKRSYLFGSDLIVTWDFTHIDGDGTVVRQSASLEDADLGWSRNFGHRVVYRPLLHGQLAMNVGLETIFRLLRDGEVSNGDPSPPFLCFTFSVHSPAEVVLTDSVGRRIGSSDGQNRYLEVPTARYDRVEDMKIVTMDASGAYTAALRGTADGEATIRIRWIDSGLVAREAVYRHVPTTTKSVGSLAFDTATLVLGDLVVDLDGNGTPDVTIHADVLNATGAADQTPPTVGIVTPKAGQAVVGSFALDWSLVDAGAGVAGSFAIVDRGSTAARTIGAPGTIALAPGSHQIEVFAEDRASNAATTSQSVIAYAYEWLEPIGAALVFEANEGRTIPGKFRVTTPAGAFVSDASVTVSMLDSAGLVVVGPLRAAASVADGVVIESGPASPNYHANVPTKGLGVGSYRIVVSFDSPTLVGQFSVAVTLR